MSPARRTWLRWLLAGLCACAVAGPAGAQEARFEYRGYVKNLGLRAKSFFEDRHYVLDVSRGRLQGLFDLGPFLHAEAWLDTELLLGSYLGSPDYALRQSLDRSTWLDLDWIVAGGDRYALRQSLFRAFVNVYAGRAQVTVGRQRVAWGTGFVWNPTDLLNPVNPAAIERDEKAGVDAVHVAVPLGVLSRFEAVAAPGSTRDRTSVAARAGTNVREYDLAVMGGYFREDWVLGGDFAGYVGDAGLRGELAHTWRADGRNYLRAVLNADYSFPGDYYVFAELYYNGAGTRDKADYDYDALFAGVLFNVARDYAALSATKALTPLIAVSLYGLLNLDDGSGLAGPALAWSLSENLELTASTYLFSGAGDTEFGRQENVYFASIQYFF